MDYKIDVMADKEMNHMISVNIKVVDIEYERTFQQIFPLLKEKLGAVESNNLFIRLFQKLDDAALPVLLGIMERLPESTKDEILAACLNTYSGRICMALNAELLKHSYGKFLKTGRVSIVQEENALYFWIIQIQVDYKGLVREKITGKMGGIASLFVGEKLEKLALELLWTEENKQKLIKLAQAALGKYGFVMGLADIQMTKDMERYVESIETEEHLLLTDEMEMDILDALAGYLRDREVETKLDNDTRGAFSCGY